MQEQTSAAVMSSRQAKKFQLSSELAKLKVERLEELRQEGPAQLGDGQAAGAEGRRQDAGAVGTSLWGVNISRRRRDVPNAGQTKGSHPKKKSASVWFFSILP